MQRLALSLAVYIFILSVMPCTDSLALAHVNEAVNCESVIGDFDLEHGHDHDSDDTCSPFCSCACCGTVIGVTAISPFMLVNYDMSGLYEFHYSFGYLFEYLFPVWHPPLRG